MSAIKTMTKQESKNISVQMIQKKRWNSSLFHMCVLTWQRVTQTIWGRGTTPYNYRNKEAEVKHLLPEANNHKTRPTKTEETWTIHGTINGNAQGLQVNNLHLSLSWVPIYRCLYRRSHCSWSVHPTQQDLDWNQQEQFTLLSEIMPAKRG